MTEKLTGVSDDDVFEQIGVRHRALPGLLEMLKVKGSDENWRSLERKYIYIYRKRRKESCAKTNYKRKRIANQNK